LSAGWSHTCGLTGTGRGYCWGENQNGQLGAGTIYESSAPLPVVAQDTP
jgi:alpha-tubulin suppressor-like RCC1 family protein